MCNFTAREERMRAKNALWLGAAFVAAPLFGLGGGTASAGDLGSYSTVTQQRLENPEVENWLLYRRTYDSHGFSPLHQITADNVKDLVPVWTFATGVTEGHQAPPMVNNGIMFVTTPT